MPKKTSSGGFWGRTKARLGKKLGPLPVWVWLAVALGGAVLYVRHRNAASPAVAAAAPAASDTGASSDLSGYDTGSGGGGGGGSLQPSQPLSDTAPVSWDPGQATVVPTPQVSPDTAPAPAATAPTATAPSYTVQPFAGGGPPNTAGGGYKPLPAYNRLPGSPVSQLLAAHIPAGATDVTRLKSGAITYRGPGGGMIEQAPGKTRYAIHPAHSSAPPAAKKPATHPAAKAAPARHTVKKAAAKPLPYLGRH